MKFSVSTAFALTALAAEVAALGGLPGVNVKSYDESVHGKRGVVQRNLAKRQQQVQYHRQYIPDNHNIKKREEDIVTETATVFVTVTVKRDGTTVTPTGVSAASAETTPASTEDDGSGPVIATVTETSSTLKVSFTTSTADVQLPDAEAKTSISYIIPEVPEPTVTSTTESLPVEPTVEPTPEPEPAVAESKPAQTWTTVTMTTCETICPTATPAPELPCSIPSQQHPPIQPHRSIQRHLEQHHHPNLQHSSPRSPDFHSRPNCPI